MSLLIKDRDGIERAVQTVGAGTLADPYREVIANRSVELAAGNLANIQQFIRCGKTGALASTATDVTLWTGDNAYTGFPTGSAEQMEVLSDDLNDTSAGTGARTVKISGLLDSTGAEVSDVTVSLNGTTPVSLGAGTYYRAANITVLTAGSTGSNVGNITLRHSTTTTNVFAIATPTLNESSGLFGTVPLGKTLYVDNAVVQLSRINGGAGSGDVTFKTRQHGGLFLTPYGSNLSNSSPGKFENNGVMVLPERTDFYVNIETISDNSTYFSGKVSGELVTN